MTKTELKQISRELRERDEIDERTVVIEREEVMFESRQAAITHVRNCGYLREYGMQVGLKIADIPDMEEQATPSDPES